MNTTFKTSFIKDVKKIPAALRKEIDAVITTVEHAKTLKEIPNLKKLTGHQEAYRIKIKDHRLCFYLENNTIKITRFLPRKDVYRFFP